MCGFAGCVDLRASSPRGELEHVASSMVVALEHRGPDADGVWTDPEFGVALGHRRLAVVDLSPLGSQPMVSVSGNLVLVFNGEIYNHPALRTDLQSAGVVFRGSSDTEVLVEGFERWGIEETLRRAVGMFALAVWDRERRELTLTRDRLGEKPLCYGWAGSTFLFGSTLSALKRHPSWNASIDRDVLALYFGGMGYVPDPWSIYQGFFKLPPGSVLCLPLAEVRAGELPEPHRYWSLLDVAREGSRHPFTGDDGEAVERLTSLMSEAVKDQMVADVPVGAFLSSGIDSSCVVALMQQHSSVPVRTFTAGFDDVAYDESDAAAHIARHLGTDHTEFRVSPNDLLEVLPRLPSIFEEPFADPSQVPTTLIAQLARRDVTVSLSGDGGDEVFCGYNHLVRLLGLEHQLRKFPRFLRRAGSAALSAVPTSAYDALLRRRGPGVHGDQIQKLAAIMGMRTIDEMYVFLMELWGTGTGLVLGARPPTPPIADVTSWPRDVSELSMLMWVESVTSLPGDMLTKIDRASMASSLEVRAPMLDHRVVEFAWSLPDRFRVRGKETKWLLRQVLYQYVPRQLVDRPKWGFGVPIDAWLRGPLRDWAEALLDADRLRSQGLLDVGQVRSCWQEHQRGRRNWQGKLWAVLMFQAWLDGEGVSDLS